MHIRKGTFLKSPEHALDNNTLQTFYDYYTFNVAFIIDGENFTAPT